jgi:hypothetical protein
MEKYVLRADVKNEIQNLKKKEIDKKIKKLCPGVRDYGADNVVPCFPPKTNEMKDHSSMNPVFWYVQST